MNQKYSLNNNWRFQPSFCQDDLQRTNFETYHQVHLPHTVKELPYNCFSQKETLMVSTYVKQFTLPDCAQGKRAIVRFEGVMAQCRIYVNGTEIGTHLGGYSAFQFDITPFLQPSNTMIVVVDSREDNNIPPFGHTIDFLTYGGIYRDVDLYLVDPIYVERFLLDYRMEGDNAVLFPRVFMQNHEADCEAVFTVCLRRDGQIVKEYSRTEKLAAGQQILQLSDETFEAPLLWDIESPNLYTAEVSVSVNGRFCDSHQVRVGFRTVKCTTEGFFLNGRQVRIVGQNRHQSYPYVGYAMPARVQREDADILHDYLHVNTVRTSHYIQAPEFLDRCDELGLLVYSEIPGWGYIGGETFRKVVLNDIRSMILDQFNHPSVFIWSIRVNESYDDDELYTQANALAHELDSSRPTSGVRCITDSHLLEDVYSYNDFWHYSHGAKHYRELVLRHQQAVTGLTYKVPYLVTEYAGSIFPTKPFDPEERQIRHVLMHAAIQSTNYLRKDAMGAIGWCAFDYNTHTDYCASDKICYHGVMDMFRNPKYAAQVYRSQVSPEQEIILEPASVFCRGERDDNQVFPIAVLTNCDYITVEVYNKPAGTFFPAVAYQGLPHPPIIIDKMTGDWRDLWNGGKIVGWYKGEIVAVRDYPFDGHLSAMEVVPSSLELNTSVVDATRFACRFTDQCGNKLPFYNGIIQVQTEGDIEVIGPEIVAIVGGAISVWIKTVPTGKEGCGTVTFRALNTNLPEQKFTLRLTPDAGCKTL